MKRLLAVIVAMLVAAIASPVVADEPAVDPAAEERFRAATVRLGDGDLAGAAEAFARLADELPSSPWADDARMEAALAAERLGRLDDARRHLERLLADHPGSRLARRARARLDRLIAATGPSGEWSSVAAEHDAIVRDAAGAADPTPQVRRLERLVRDHAGYPRVFEARMWIGDAWMRLGDREQGLAWYREAVRTAPDAAARFRAGRAVGDALAARGDLEGAAATYQSLRGEPGVDLEALDRALARLEIVRARARHAHWAWALLAGLVIASAVALRRSAGSWRAAARALFPPPTEVLYLAPVAAVLIGIGLGGNRLVAGALRWIVLGGLAIAWLSGAVFAAAARHRGRLMWPRVAVHIAAVIAAVAAVAYLAIMRDQLLDMLIETWRHGHDR